MSARTSHRAFLAVVISVFALACGKAPAPAAAESPATEPAATAAPVAQQDPAAPQAHAAVAAPVAATGDDPHASRTVHPREPGKSLPFTLVVAVDQPAKSLLTAKGESIRVLVTFSDGVPGDEGGYREQSFVLPADGGIVNVPGVDLSPVKGRPLIDFSVTVSSARKAAPDNLLACDPLTGAVDTLLPRLVVNCKPL